MPDGGQAYTEKKIQELFKKLKYCQSSRISSEQAHVEGAKIARQLCEILKLFSDPQKRLMSNMIAAAYGDSSACLLWQQELRVYVLDERNDLLKEAKEFLRTFTEGNKRLSQDFKKIIQTEAALIEEEIKERNRNREEEKKQRIERDAQKLETFFKSFRMPLNPPSLG